MAQSRSLTAVVLACISLMPAAAYGQTEPAPAAPPVALAPAPTEALTPTAAPPVSAPMPRLSALFRPLGQDFRRIAAGRNLALIGVGAGSAMASHALDARVSARPWGIGMMEESLEPGRFVGDFMIQTGGAFATYAVGRLTGKPRVATIGAELFRAQIVAQGTTQLLKVSTRRTRPDGTRLSFPSGHTAAAFATASVLHAELGWKVGVPAYALAAWVGVSRMQADRHFVSDVIAGATVGLLAGRSVTFGHGNTRFALRPTAMPGGIGISIGRVSKN